MITSIEKNLYRGITLLETISDEQYTNKTIPPYFSSIGCNMRHLLDAFNAIFIGLETGLIDFTDRKRDTICEQNTKDGIAYFKLIISKLKTVDSSNLNKIVFVKDDLGSGETTIKYTLESVFAYAHSHAIHHFASVGFLTHHLGIKLPNTAFGNNPTTPKKQLSNSL